MVKSVSVVLVGIGGYGNLYVNRIMNNSLPNNVSIAGVVDPHPENCEHYDWIKENNIPVYTSIEDFYKKHSADLAIISTPINFHASQTCYALNHGSSVLCEKPMSASAKDAEMIINTRNRTKKFVAIGFNWSFTSSVQQLKQDIIDGVFGKPKRLKTMVLWPRNEDYYHRASWAGKKRNQNGELILDSVANNATAHFLHHMFYLLGSKTDESARLTHLTAELYRANQIENFDTCAVKAQTEDNIDILFYAAHPVKDEIGPKFTLEFEKATITYSMEDKTDVIARFHDGTEKRYTDPEKNHLQKFETCIEAILKGNQDILCGPEASFPHTLSINAMQESVTDIPNFPKELIKRDKATNLIWVDGLEETLINCYDHWMLPNEIGINWSVKGKTIDLTYHKSVFKNL
ncbi:Gfo/Idh/MocA family protein [Scopulibacillus cellulosilyticus]|uniref:Gfo/Idh/MocA family protein n=1 Tax=Scopulibacillus cellulosilyticus TaxID=2665665 RepID=A0ABW2Q087_9BACL